MSKQTESNRFIFPSFSWVAEFYQRLLSGITSYEGLAVRILKRIETAHAFRQVKQVRGLASVLAGIPIREHQLTAQYYLAWCNYRELKHQNAALLETIVEQSQTCKTKALFSRGAVEWYGGNNDSALYFYSEALRTSPTISEYVDLSRTIAVVKGTEGFHRSAIRDLEKLLPVIRYAEPRVYYDYLNTLAVELAAVGRLTEAWNASQNALASPFACAYLEWRETHEEIAEQRTSRSVVGFSAATVPEPSTLLHMPVRERSAHESFTAQQRAVVFDLLDWKKKEDDEQKRTPTKTGYKRREASETQRNRETRRQRDVNADHERSG